MAKEICLKSTYFFYNGPQKVYYMTKLKEHSREIINSKWRNHIQVLRQPGTFGGTKVLVPGTITNFKYARHKLQP